MVTDCSRVLIAQLVQLPQYRQDYRKARTRLLVGTSSIQRPQALRNPYNLFTATTDIPELIQPLYSDHRDSEAHATSLQRPQVLRSPSNLFTATSGTKGSINLFTATIGNKEPIQPIYSDHRHSGAHATCLQRPQALRS